ncbi:MAG TPA: STAS domain-containing protein [Spirochaetota bacterium]|nr:STAS domain-containing protein [Spirochaetota bacterium]
MRMKGTRRTLADGTVALSLEGEFTIYTAKKLGELLMKEMGNGGRVELDLEGVSRFDSAGYQLLEHTRREAMKRGGALTVAGRSSEVESLYALYGTCR